MQPHPLDLIPRTIYFLNSKSIDNSQSNPEPMENYSFWRNNSAFSLVELIVSVLLLTMITGMVYSVLNVGIKFSKKGETQLQAIEREHGFINLINAQVNSALYDRVKKTISISSEDDVLRISTRHPLLYHDTKVVLALYRFNSSDQAVYYMEKKDFYNEEYDEEYIPDFDEMIFLMETQSDFVMEYDDETEEVLITFEEGEYVFTPKCSSPNIL